MARIRACDVCYRKKIQCHLTGANEPCNWCIHHKLPCTFTREPQTGKRNRVKLSDVQELHTRIAQLESALARSRTLRPPIGGSPHSSDGPVSLDVDDEDSPSQNRVSESPNNKSNHSERAGSQSSTPQTNTFLKRPHPSSAVPENHLGQNWFCKGLAVFSEKGQVWVSSKTGGETIWNKLKVFCGRPCLPPSSLQLLLSPKELLRLPTRGSVHKALDSFFGSSFQFLFPILDRVLFEQTIATAYEKLEDPLSSLAHVSARACVLAALSLMCRLEESVDILVGIDGDICAAKSQHLLGHVTGDASLVNLQTALLLERHRSFTGQKHDAISLHAIACRMVSTLGGHIYTPISSPSPEISLFQRQTKHIRTLFWRCYMLDKDISLRSGQPPLFTEEFCDLDFQVDPAGTCSFSPATDPERNIDSITPDEALSHTLVDVHLMVFKERVYRLLFSPQALKTTDGQLLLHIRELDSELEQWRSSIAPDYRPQLSVLPNHPLLAADVKTPQGVRCLTLQLEYHYLLTVIHTTVRRCGAITAEDNTMAEDLHTVVHSSTDLSLEASRSTLSLLKSSIGALRKEVFCDIVFYPTVAAMSLLTNILLHPFSAQGKLDLDTLGTTINIIQSMPAHVLTRDDIKHMQDLVEFMMELVRIGRCAIAKAKRPAS